MTFTRCRLYTRTKAGTDPEAWQDVDEATRRVAITPLTSPRHAIEESARLNLNVTHFGRAAWDDEWDSGRLLKRLDDERYFLIRAVEPAGRVRRGASHAPKVRLSLSVHNAEVNL